MKDCGYEFNQVRGNGFCILAAVVRALLFDHSYLASIGTIQERIIQHLLRRPDLYEGFLGGSPEDLATEAANFFEDKKFQQGPCRYSGVGCSRCSQPQNKNY